MRGLKIATAALLALGTAGCVGAALPSGTLVSGPPPVFAPPPPPPVYAAPPPPRCYWQDGPYGPERVCRPRPYY